MARDSYDRHISSEEAREGYVLIEKNRLAFFPPIDQQFQLKYGGAQRPATIEARDCVCRGPEKPHQHCFVRVDGLRKGSNWRITRDGGGYRLEPA